MPTMRTHLASGAAVIALCLILFTACGEDDVISSLTAPVECAVACSSCAQGLDPRAFTGSDCQSCIDFEAQCQADSCANIQRQCP